MKVINKPLAVLVVDDEPANIDILVGILSTEYQVSAAVSGAKTLELVVSNNPPDLILLDVMMPELDGYEVCRRLKENPATSTIPVIFVTAKGQVEDEVRGLEVGAVDYISKPVIPAIVKARVRTHLSLSLHEKKLEALVAERTRELEESQREVIYLLGRAAEYKDEDTSMHLSRVSHYSRLIAEASGMNPARAEQLFYAAPLHDIGMVGIPDSITQNLGRLSDADREVMQGHCDIGAEIIGDEPASDLLKMATTIILSHHERWDGSGYPEGLCGQQIPVEGRIIAIADTFDSLTSMRPYRGPVPFDQAVKIIEEEAGTHFDPELVQCFRSVLPGIRAIQKEYAEFVVEALG